MTQTITAQRRSDAGGTGTYDVYIEIDIDCEPLLDTIGLEYVKSTDDDTQNEVALSLTKDEWSDFSSLLTFNDTNEQTIATELLNPELGEYTTKVTIYKPSGDKITFE
jgi:hypothetical protein